MRIALLLAALLLNPTHGHAQNKDTEAQAIRQVIESAYVNGVFVNRDASAVRSGFHPSFVMAVQDGDSVIAVTLDMWLDRMQLDGKPSTDNIRHVVARIDVTGATASAKVKVWINDKHTYTDYLSLYRLSDGWKIVTKVFASHS